jgi:hypothetical protein
MKSRTALLGALVAGVATLAACNTGSSVHGYTPIQPCVIPSGTTVTLAYPIPGATGVPDSPAQIVVAVSSPLPAGWQVVLGFNGAGYAAESLLTPIAPSAIPTPYAAPTSTPISYEGSGLTSALPGGTLVQVLLNDQTSSCNGYPQIGTFTTQ